MKKFKFSKPVNINNEQYTEGAVTKYTDGANAIILNKANKQMGPDSLIVSVNLGIHANDVIVLDANHFSDADLDMLSNALIDAGILEHYIRNVQSGFIDDYRLYALSDKYQYAEAI